MPLLSYLLYTASSKLEMRLSNHLIGLCVYHFLGERPTDNGERHNSPRPEWTHSRMKLDCRRLSRNAEMLNVKVETSYVRSRGLEKLDKNGNNDTTRAAKLT